VLEAIGAAEWLSVPVILPPLEWIELLDLTNDPTSARNGLLKLDPYQRDPIAAQFDPAIREVVVMAVEQTGKSTIWRMPMLYKMQFEPGPRWIIYESDDKAEDINSSSFLPLVRAVPELASLINRGKITKRRYFLPNGTVLDFSGAGADITSKPERDGVADELDRWPLTIPMISQNLRNFRKRFRTFWRINQGCLVIVSSPKGTDSPIADQFDATSQGHWYLRCLKCQRLTIPSHAIHRMQWETTEAGHVVADSIRIECPACGHAHPEADAVGMNDRGGYRHKDDENKAQRGYQWGAMAAPRVFSWGQIAAAQLAAGRTADVHAQADFDNTWRGIRFKPRKAREPTKAIIREHCAVLPDPDTLANVFLSADTQDSGWYWIVRGLDVADNTYRLGYGLVKTIEELRAVWDASYLGIQCELGIIDEGGHGERPIQAKKLAAATRGLYTYKGNSRIGTRWKRGSERDLILAIPQQYQADLLYYIYAQPDKSNHYWFLPPEAGDDYIEHIAALRPNNKARHGDRYENWDNNREADHWFDCEKMWLVLLDYARKHLRTWRLPVPWGAPARKADPREVVME